MSKPLNPGKYNKRIKIINPEPIDRDADGFKTESETVILSPWAEVKTTSGAVILKNDSDFTKALTRFTIRYTAVEIKKGYIILYAGKRYRIEYVNDINESHTELEIQTKRIEK